MADAFTAAMLDRLRHALSVRRDPAKYGEMNGQGRWIVNNYGLSQRTVVNYHHHGRRTAALVFS